MPRNITRAGQDKIDPYDFYPGVYWK